MILDVWITLVASFLSVRIIYCRDTAIFKFVAHNTNICATSRIARIYDIKSQGFQVTNSTNMFEVIFNN